MRVRTWLIGCLGVLVTATFAPCASASGAFAGQFISDRRPQEVLFLSLTQVDAQVSGYLILVSAAERGRTESRTLRLDGIADSKSVSLRQEGLLADYALSGRREGSNIVLHFPDKSGAVTSATFAPSSEVAYSQLLSNWRSLRVQTYEERSNLEQISSKLAGQLKAIIDTQIPKRLGEARQALSDQKAVGSEIAARRARFEKLATHSRARTCDYVYADVSGYFHDELAGYFYSDYSPVEHRFRDAESDLGKRIEYAPGGIAEVEAQANQLRVAIKAAKFEHPGLPAPPKGAAEALAGYRPLVARATVERASMNEQYASVDAPVKLALRESERELARLESACQ